MNAYKFGFSGLESTLYSPYEVNDHLPRTDVSRRTWDNPSTLNSEEPATSDMQPGGMQLWACTLYLKNVS